MGDRCSLSITLRRDDLPKLLKLLGFSDQEIQRGCGGDVETEDNNDGSTTVRFHEANYGLYSERQDLAAMGVAYYGSHGAGGDYGPAAFASAGRQWADVPISQSGETMVPVSETGVPDDAAVKEVRLYHRLLREARERIRGGKTRTEGGKRGS